MLTPNQIGNAPQTIVDLFADLEEFILTDIARRLKKAGKMTSSAEWQRNQAQLMGMYNVDSKVASILNLSDSEITQLFPTVALASFKAEMEIYKRAKLGSIDFKSKPIQDYIKSAIKTAKGDIENLTKSMGFAEIRDGHVVYNDVAKFYHKELNLAHTKIVTGSQDYNTAIKQAVRKIADSGVRYVNYESGRSTNIDTAARRAVVTGVHNMNQEMTNHCMNELVPPDEQYAEVSAHSNARPTHATWQGGVYKVVGSDENYDNLEEVTELGSVSGLCGANCRHSYYVFIPGVSERTYTAKQLKELDTPNFTYKDKEYTGYTATQYQRQIENQVRTLKREALMYKETGLQDEFKATNAKIRDLRAEYKEFSNASGISQKNNRMQI